MHYLWISSCWSMAWDSVFSQKKSNNLDKRTQLNCLTSKSRWLQNSFENKGKSTKPIELFRYFFLHLTKADIVWFDIAREEFSSQPNADILAGNQRSGPVKVSVVGGGQGGSKIWRRERIEMTDPDLDDVAFLSGMNRAKGHIYFLNTTHEIQEAIIITEKMLFSFCRLDVANIRRAERNNRIHCKSKQQTLYLFTKILNVLHLQAVIVAVVVKHVMGLRFVHRNVRSVLPQSF